VRRLLVLLLIVVVLPGCGYSLAGRGSFLPAYIQAVGIPELLNRTPFYDVEQVLTGKVRAEFIGRGKYRITPDTNGVDAVLTGEVLNIAVQPVGFTDQQLASRYQFILQMRVAFADSRTGEVLWSNDALTFREEYELATRGNTALEGAAFLDQERAAFDRIATDIARTVVTAILEAF
jgi:Lipopolysaccharide-assembly